jgi:hypothetical protein
MIKFTTTGSWSRSEAWLDRLHRGDMFKTLDKYGKMGVEALAAATPVDSGLAASSWSYKVSVSRTHASISWLNTDTADGVPVVILLQYGHGTGTGGYVQGRDFINPAIKPIFDQISNDVWKAVTS